MAAELAGQVGIDLMDSSDCSKPVLLASFKYVETDSVAPPLDLAFVVL